MFEVKQIKLDDLFCEPEFKALCERYANECKIREIPNGKPMFEAYAEIESDGKLVVLGAYLDDDLVGFAVIHFVDFKHHGYPMAMLDAVFLDKPARAGTRGLRLVRAAKQVAKDRGAPGLWLSAPVGSNMDRIASALGFRQTNVVYFAPCGEGEQNGY